MNHEQKITVEDIEMSVDNLNFQKAADIFEQHGCLVVRGHDESLYQRITQGY